MNFRENLKLTNKIIIGAWSFGGDLGRVNIKKVHKAIEFAIKNNLKVFDTAPSYKLGKVDRLLSRYKDKIKINTKCGHDKNGNKTFNKYDIEKSLENSLKLFKKINILYLHNPRSEIKNWDRIINLLNQFKKKKLIKYTGISIARDHYFSLDILNEFDFIQDDINILHLKNLNFLKKTKCKIVARSPLANGLLKNSINNNTKFLRNDYRWKWCKGKRFKNILKQLKEIKKIYNGDISEFAQNFLFYDENIKFINFGIKNQFQIQKLLRATKLPNMNKIYSKKIDQLVSNNYHIDKEEEIY